MGRHTHHQRLLRTGPLRAPEGRRVRGLELGGREGPERHVRRVRGLPGRPDGRLCRGRSRRQGPGVPGRPGRGAGGSPEDGRGQVRSLLRGLRGRALHLKRRGEVLRHHRLRRVDRRDQKRGGGGQEEGALGGVEHLRHRGARRLPGPGGREQRGRAAGREVRFPLRGDYLDLRFRDAGGGRGSRRHRGGQRARLAGDHLLYSRRLRHVRLRADALDDARPRARHRLRALLREPFSGGARGLLDGRGHPAHRGDGGALHLLLRDGGPDRALRPALLPLHVHALYRGFRRGRGLRLRLRGPHVPAGPAGRPRPEGEPAAHPAHERRPGPGLLEPERRGGDAAALCRDRARRRHPRRPALPRHAHEGRHPGGHGPARQVRVAGGRRPPQGELRVRRPEPHGDRRRRRPRPADGRGPRRHEETRRAGARGGGRRPRRERLHGGGGGGPRLRRAGHRRSGRGGERGLGAGGRARRGADPAADRAAHRRGRRPAALGVRGDIRRGSARHGGTGKGRGGAAGRRGGQGGRG